MQVKTIQFDKDTQLTVVIFSDDDLEPRDEVDANRPAS